MRSRKLRIAWGQERWSYRRFISRPIQAPTKSRNIFGVQDSNTLWGRFEDLNDVGWRKSEYQSCRSFRALHDRVRVCIIWTSDDEVMVEILKGQNKGSCVSSILLQHLMVYTIMVFQGRRWSHMESISQWWDFELHFFKLR